MNNQSDWNYCVFAAAKSNFILILEYKLFMECVFVTPPSFHRHGIHDACGEASITTIYFHYISMHNQYHCDNFCEGKQQRQYILCTAIFPQIRISNEAWIYRNYIVIWRPAKLLSSIRLIWHTKLPKFYFKTKNMKNIVLTFMFVSFLLIAFFFFSFSSKWTKFTFIATENSIFNICNFKSTSTTTQACYHWKCWLTASSTGN